MLKKNFLMMIALLGLSLSIGCAHTATIKQPVYGPFLRKEPLSEEALDKIRTTSPKDIVFADLLQAFALMRSSDITSAKVRQKILDLLTSSVSSFEDMTDPINFSLAFSADENKAFRGRPHERMFASAMAGVFLMAENKYAQALPYFRNAEFLDARFQKLPFGTDAPLIYALMYRCLQMNQASSTEIKRAVAGVFRSVRFLTMQEVLIKALTDLFSIDIRPMAVSNQLAYMIMEISLYHSLISAPENFDINALIDDASKNASIFIAALNTHFEDEYKGRIEPLFKELSIIYGMSKKEGLKHFSKLAFKQVTMVIKDIGDKLKTLFAKHEIYSSRVALAQNEIKVLVQQILNAASNEKMMISFSGDGPTLAREGDYQEISVIKPSKDGSLEPKIRRKNMQIATSCGFHRIDDGGFSVVLCKPDAQDDNKVLVMPNLELLSMSRKATTAQGRRFDQVLKGRAQFRAATEKIAHISAWSSLFLFHLGAQVIDDCRKRGESQACYGQGFAIWALAGVTAVFTGTVWLFGRMSNPAADSRFIHLMYESAWVAIH
jgi:hypothetical protein